VLTATNKRLLICESHGNSNRCTSYRGKPDQHAKCFPCSVYVWASTIRISRGSHITTFHEVINRFDQIHCPQEEWLPTWSTAWQLTDARVHTQLLSENSQWSSGENSSFWWQPATRLTRSIYHHVIGTFNTCSCWPTHRSLTDTGGGYSPEEAGFEHTTAQPSWLTVSTFLLRALIVGWVPIFREVWGKLIGGDLGVDDEDSKQHQFEPVQSLHHGSVGYQPVRTWIGLAKKAMSLQANREHKQE
jgi:hypothetical protein